MKKYFYATVLTLAAAILMIAGAMIFVDPYFHFHKPRTGLSYRLYEERYINDGISRHFEFDSMITGTSMNQNFKTSQAEELFGGSFVKETFSGADFIELGSNLERAMERNPELRRVIWGIDYSGLRRDVNFVTYENKPEYLYDDNRWNDVNYLFNKDIIYSGLLNTVIRSIRGLPNTTFDEYASWDRGSGFEHVILSYDRRGTLEAAASGENVFDMETELEKARVNVETNLIPLFENHPEVDFYLFYPPYSILYWDAIHIEGTLEMQLEAERQTTERLLQFENVHLFSFFENTDLITDLDLYQNRDHYTAAVNEMILNWIAEDAYEITRENLDDHMNRMYEIYTGYDYEGWWQEHTREMGLAE